MDFILKLVKSVEIVRKFKDIIKEYFYNLYSGYKIKSFVSLRFFFRIHNILNIINQFICINFIKRFDTGHYNTIIFIN